MSSAARKARPRMGVADFIEMIAPYPDEERWELLAGEPILMAPRTERHQRVVMNILRVADRLARARGCVALPGLGMLNDEIDDYAPIPDVVVRCGPMVADGYATDPLLVAEVLSPSTMAWDRGGKLQFYQSITSLQVIVVAYQDEVRLETWLRDGAGWRHELRRGRQASVGLRAARIVVARGGLRRHPRRRVARRSSGAAVGAAEARHSPADPASRVRQRR